MFCRYLISVPPGSAGMPIRYAESMVSCVDARWPAASEPTAVAGESPGAIAPMPRRRLIAAALSGSKMRLPYSFQATPRDETGR